MVDVAGFEPAAFRMRTERSPTELHAHDRVVIAPAALAADASLIVFAAPGAVKEEHGRFPRRQKCLTLTRTRW